MGTCRPPADQATLAPREPRLDGLRGLAILLVLIFHFIAQRLPYPQTLTQSAVALVTTTGWIGVDLFFVLSGYLITGILYDTRDAPGYFQTFYARRALRIFPLYYLYLAIYVLLLPRLFGPAPFVRRMLADQ